MVQVNLWGFTSSGKIQFIHIYIYSTLPETNSSHLKVGGWKTSFLLGRPIFKGHVSFRAGKYIIITYIIYQLPGKMPFFVAELTCECPDL